VSETGRARRLTPAGFACLPLEPDDQLNVVQKPEFQAAQYAAFRGSAHGYHHTSHHCTSHSAARRRRLVRPRTLVLNVADLKLGRRCNAAASDQLSPYPIDRREMRVGWSHQRKRQTQDPRASRSFSTCGSCSDPNGI